MNTHGIKIPTIGDAPAGKIIATAFSRSKTDSGDIRNIQLMSNSIGPITNSQTGSDMYIGTRVNDFWTRTSRAIFTPNESLPTTIQLLTTQFRQPLNYNTDTTSRIYKDGRFTYDIHITGGSIIGTIFYQPTWSPASKITLYTGTAVYYDGLTDQMIDLTFTNGGTESIPGGDVGCPSMQVTIPATPTAVTGTIDWQCGQNYLYETRDAQKLIVQFNFGADDLTKIGRIRLMPIGYNVYLPGDDSYVDRSTFSERAQRMADWCWPWGPLPMIIFNGTDPNVYVCEDNSQCYITLAIDTHGFDAVGFDLLEMSMTAGGLNPWAWLCAETY